MASSVNCGTPLYVDDAPMTAQAPFRQYDIGTRSLNLGTGTANQVAGGVYPGAGAMAVIAGSGLTVVVSAGYCCVPNSASGLQGGYVTGLMNSAALSLASADPAQKRIDLVCVTVNDLGTSASSAGVQVITGTAAASPAAPALPSDSIPLANVTVPAGASSLGPGAVADQRSWTVAPGGILPIASSTAAPAVPASQFMYDQSTSSLVQGTGTAGTVSPLPVLPWSPVVSAQTSPVSDVAAKGALTAIATAMITTDGSTDIEVYYKWTGLKASAGVPLLVTMSVAIDAVTLDQTNISVPSASVYGAGGSARYYTDSGLGTTPGPGTHTVTFAFQSASPAATTTLQAAASGPAILRVAPTAT